MSVQSVKQPTFGHGIRASFLVAALVFVLAIMAYGKGDGSATPLWQTAKVLYWGLAIIIIVIAAAGAQWAERAAERAAAAVSQVRPATAMATAWAVPATATFAALTLVATYHNRWMFVLGPAIAFLGMAGSLLSRDLLDDVGDTALRTATAIHALVIHAVAFLALGAVAYNKLPVQLAAPLVGLIGGSLVLETLARGALPPAQRVGYALLGGLALAEAMLVLDWWRSHGWTGGAVLLVCFYLIAGVLLARAQRAALRSRDLIEFGLVSLLAFAILAGTA